MGDVTTLASHGLSRRGAGGGAGGAGGPERPEGHRGLEGASDKRGCEEHDPGSPQGEHPLELRGRVGAPHACSLRSAGVPAPQPKPVTALLPPLPL